MYQLLDPIMLTVGATDSDAGTVARAALAAKQAGDANEATRLCRPFASFINRKLNAGKPITKLVFSARECLELSRLAASLPQ